MTGLTCSRCHGEVPSADHCVRCGAWLANAERTRGYAAYPGQRQLVPWITSSIFPQLPQSSMVAFRLALLLGIGLVAAAALASAFSVAIVLAATIVPALTVIYVYDVDVYEDAPFRVTALTAAWGISAGAALALLAHAIAPSPAEALSRSTSDSVLVEGVALPLVGLAVAVAGPLALLFDRRFDDVLDGVTFGVASAVWLAATKVLLSSAGFVDDGLQPGGSTVEWMLRLTALAVAGPVLWAAVVGSAAGSVWLRYRVPRGSRARDDRLLRSPALALSLAAVVVVVAACVQLFMPLELAVPVLLALTGGSVLWLRRCIHVGLLDEGAQGEIGGSGRCASCGEETLLHTFCGNCGIALRALPKAGVGAVDEAIRFVAGFSPARIADGLVPIISTVVLLVLSGAAATAVLFLAPTVAAPTCEPGEPCGGPPSTSPLVAPGTDWTGDGVSLSYDGGRWLTAESDHDRLVLRRTDGSAMLDVSAIEGRHARAVIAPARLPVKLRALERLGVPLYEPGLGFVDGEGAWYAGFLDSPQGPRDSVTIAAVAAQRRGLTVRATAVFFSTRDELFGRDGMRALRGEVDSILNTVRWTTRGETQAASAPADRTVPSGERAMSATPRGVTPPGTPVDLLVALSFPGEPALRLYAQRVNEHDSPQYGRHLAVETVGSRFGLSDATLGRLLRRLERRGLRVLSVNPQRTLARVRAPAGVVGRAFGTTLLEFELPDGTRFRRPGSRPRIPADLRFGVHAVLGLDTEPFLRRAGATAQGAGGLLPADAAAAYDVDALWAAGFRGQGQTVAIVSFDSFRQQDIDAFERLAGIASATPVERVRVGDERVELGPNALEVSLDIEVVRGLAPEATIVSYEAPLGWQGFVDVLARINEDDRADIVSVSWGKCLARVAPEVVEAMEREHTIAVAAGRTVFVASGDSGAYSCLHSESELDAQSHVRSVDWPAASPNVVAVGGTRLTRRADGAYFAENAWEDVLSNRASGGGVSTIHPRPLWQRGSGVRNAFSTGNRQVPDVAGPADCDNAFLVVYPRRRDSGWEQVTAAHGCGTSAAAPFWAGIAALLRQYGADQGVDLGFLAPSLYGLAWDGTAAFRDVQTGGNLGSDATRGWDYATGLGTPRAWELAKELVGSARDR